MNKSKAVTDERAHFKEIRDSYALLREKEKNKIIAYLDGKGFRFFTYLWMPAKKKEKTGCGIGALKNLKWVNAEKNGFKYFISLQAFNIDKKTGNHHVVMDRIGVYKFQGDYDGRNALYEMKDTGIDLPITDKELDDLLKKFLS